MKTEILKPLKTKLDKEDKCNGSVWFCIIMSVGVIIVVLLLTN